MDEFTAGWIEKWVFAICKTICTVLPSSNERIRMAALELAVQRKSSDEIYQAKKYESYIRNGE